MEYLKNFILSHNDWEDILTSPPYSLRVQRDNGLILFKYNQLSSDFSLPEVREARGIIFDESNWECVCRAFDKFGNYGEGYVEELDWENGVSVQEKVDGSLIKSFFYHGKWMLATNGSINAFTTPTGGLRHQTFGELFTYAIRGYNSFEEFAEANLDKNSTTMFELVSPVNRVVIPYDYYGIYYLGQRDMRTMKEYCNREKWADGSGGIKLPTIYNLSTLDDVVASAQKLPWDQEGYVCVDKKYNRCKIKSVEYVMAHYARNNNTISQKHILNIILNGEVDEFLIYADDFKDKLCEIDDKMRRYKTYLNEQSKCVDTSIPKKDYVAYVQNNFDKTCHDFLMKYYDNTNYDAETYTSDWDAYKWDRVLNSLKLWE